MAITHTSTSAELFERAKKVLPGGVNSPVRAFRSVGGSPFFTASANGPYLNTVDGKSLIDYVCTWGPAIHGHNNPEIASTIQAALANGVCFGTSSPNEILLAEKLIQHVKSLQKVRLVNSGTEATMTAIRLARGYTQRQKIIKFSGCYHGHVDSLLVKAGSGALTFGNPDSAGVTTKTAEDTIVLPYNNSTLLEQTFTTHGKDIAGVIIEPYPGNCGLLLPKNKFLQKLRTLCSEYNSVLIFDEVMTGFRIGIGGVQTQENIQPDLTTLGKIIGGGLPIGAFGGKQEIMDCLAPLGPVYQAGTFAGHPLAMAAGLKSIELLETTNPYTDLDNKGKQIKHAVESAALQKGIPLQFHQASSMFSFFFNPNPVNTYEDVLTSSKDLFNKVFHFALNNNLYLPPSPFESAFISSAHSNSIIEKTCEVLSAAIKQL